eukprot:TRINITY_DN12138_c0_g1_i1.p1 TRINITY_DN12138_c0_g1~~TRINITY_DN12138_c0_g1_i1.p1  ORF type:complete len:515 (+),score=122.12 TRINITY_DN12138_c0_g1_i1:89-1633(+)
MASWEATAAATAPVEYRVHDARVALAAIRSESGGTTRKRALQRQDTPLDPHPPCHTRRAGAVSGSCGVGSSCSKSSTCAATPAVPAPVGRPRLVQPPGACIPERRAARKPHRRPSNLQAGKGIKVLETKGPQTVQGSDDEEEVVEQPEEPSGKYRRLTEAFRAGKDHSQAILDKLPSTFADDYFAAPNSMKLHRQAVLKVTSMPLDSEEAAEHKYADNPKLFAGWLQLLQVGFGVCVQGVGSKRRLLEAFADETLLPWGAAVARMAAFNARFSTVQCLREILEQVHPGSQRLGASADALAESIILARKTADLAKLRPLVLLVHNIEVLPQGHQAALSMLRARGRRVYLVASVDSIWAPVTWTPRMQEDFCFVPSRVNTHEPYGDEAAVRFVGGLPGWADASADKRKTNKQSLVLVLRSLTKNHSQLVQVIAEHQVKREGRWGISRSALLELTTEKMIAKHAAQLKAMLNELKDHEVVVERNGSDGSLLYMVACDDRTLLRLAEGNSPDGSDDEA